MDNRIIEKLRKVLALTNSPVEAEARLAAERLQELLTAYNLDIADLEQKGGHASPTIKEDSHDLGKAAFKWKLNLAEVIAEHYFCVPIVNHYAKTVAFVGRPENVESLKMLYQWLIDQIRRISSEERKKHIQTTGEHIDPLRWQVGFGEGAVIRLGERLHEIKKAREEAEAKSSRSGTTVTALVRTRMDEINDWLEKKYGYRRDGRPTKAQMERTRQWEERQKAMQELKERDPAAYYEIRPWEKPDSMKTAEELREEKKQEARERARARRREARWAREWRDRRSPEQIRKERQSYTARESGEASADRINLEPFLAEGRAPIGDLDE